MISGDSTLREPNIPQTLHLGLGTSAQGFLLCAPVSDPLVKTGEGSAASTEDVSGIQMLTANVGLQSWVQFVTYSVLVKQIILLGMGSTSHILVHWSNAKLFCLLELWGTKGRYTQSHFGFGLI